MPCVQSAGVCGAGAGGAQVREVTGAWAPGVTLLELTTEVLFTPNLCGAGVCGAGAGGA
jgi:hypothetical protein